MRTPTFDLPIKRLFICPPILELSVRSQTEVTVCEGKQTPRIDRWTDFVQADIW